MAKFYGKIGFIDTVETEPGVWVEESVEREYTGDLIKNYSRVQNSTSVVNSIVVSNNISIIADPYAEQNFHSIRYAEFMGTKWKIESVDVQYPRLILTMGGKYNG